MSNVTTLQRVPREKLILLGVFFAAIFMALLWFNFNAQSAHAGGGTSCDPSIPGCISAGTGGGAPSGGGGSGGGTSTPTRPAPPRSSLPTTGRSVPDPNNKTFGVGCSSWSGSGSWKPSASCTTTEAARESAGGPPATGNGVLLGSNRAGGSYYQGGTYFLNDQACNPAGQKSAYQQTWHKVATIGYQDDYEWKWTPDSAGLFPQWKPVKIGSHQIGTNVVYNFVGCSYPVDAFSYENCFYNYNGSSLYSNDRTRNIASWTSFGVRGRQAGDPATPTGGFAQTAPNCQRTGSAAVSYNLPVSALGYYNVKVLFSFNKYTDLKWVTPSGTVLWNQWSKAGPMAGSATTWWAYSCRPNSANLTEGAFNSQGSIPSRDQYLNSAACPQNIWECQAVTKSTVGLNTALVGNGSLSASKPVTVMRNGKKVPVNFSQIKIVDYTGGSAVDVTKGQTSRGVKGISNIEYNTTVKAGSTPYFSTDPNGANQYFKMYADSSPSSLTTEKFNTWYSNVNGNLNKGLSFVWSSDSGKPFVAQRTYRVTGTFLVARGGSIGAGSSAGAAPGGGQWLRGTYGCMTWSNRTPSRTSTGILTTPTNQVNVSRSVNNPN